MFAKTLQETGSHETKTPCMPEQLFVFGLRCVQNGFDNQYLEQWRDVWVSYSRHFGPNGGRPVLDALWQFVRAYRRTAGNPTGYHCLGCPCMTRDEYLSMALISALQHQDGACATKCLDELVPGAGRMELESRAWQLAAEYLCLHQRFFPVSVTDVERTLQATDALRDAKDATLH